MNKCEYNLDTKSKNAKFSRKGLRTWIEISKNAVKKNYEIFRGVIGKKCFLMAIVKSNAYGHNLAEFSLLMQQLGTDWFGVDSVVEALALRKAGVKKPILVLGYTLSENFSQAADKNISLTVSSFEHLEKLRNFARKTGKGINIHIKIGRGMRRQGFYSDQIAKVVKIIKACPKIRPEGIYTHFAAAKNPALPKNTLNQIKEFEKAVQATKSFGFNPIKHVAATSGTILFLQSHYDMARVGIGLYDLWPSKEIKSAFENKIALSHRLSMENDYR